MTSNASNESTIKERIINCSTLNTKGNKNRQNNNESSETAEKIIYDSRDEKPSSLNKIEAYFCVWHTIVLVWLTSFVCLFFVFSGSRILQAIFGLILIYQYFFAKRSETYRRYLKSLGPQYYFKSFKLIAEGDLKEKNCLYPFHPHGVITVSPTIACAVSDILYKAHYCVSSVMLNIPISGIFAKLLGSQPIDNKTFKNMMKNEENIIFIPGGFEEATINDYNKNKIFIKPRTGFIKYALEYGYSIIPCFAFNENKLYYTLPYFEKFRLFLNKMKFPGALAISKLLIFPHTDVDITIVMAKPIEMPKIEHPIKEEVEKYHKLYIDEVVKLYYKYSEKYGDASKLEVY